MTKNLYYFIHLKKINDLLKKMADPDQLRCFFPEPGQAGCQLKSNPKGLSLGFEWAWPCASPRSHHPHPSTTSLHHHHHPLPLPQLLQQQFRKREEGLAP
jgi:hypothetical protein